MCGFGPHQLGLRENSAIWLGTYLVSTNGPPDTTGAGLVNVFSAEPLPVAYFFQTCSGRMDSPWNWASTLATGRE